MSANGRWDLIRRLKVNTLQTGIIFWPKENIALLEVSYASSALSSENSSVRMSRVRDFVSLVNTEMSNLGKVIICS